MHFSYAKSGVAMGAWPLARTRVASMPPTMNKLHKSKTTPVKWTAALSKAACEVPYLWASKACALPSGTHIQPSKEQYPDLQRHRTPWQIALPCCIKHPLTRQCPTTASGLQKAFAAGRDVMVSVVVGRHVMASVVVVNVDDVVSVVVVNVDVVVVVPVVVDVVGFGTQCQPS